jgi:hypothetical protein
VCRFRRRRLVRRRALRTSAAPSVRAEARSWSPSTARTLELVLGRDDRAKAVPFDLVSPFPARGHEAASGEHGLGERRRKGTEASFNGSQRQLPIASAKIQKGTGATPPRGRRRAPLPLRLGSCSRWLSLDLIVRKACVNKRDEERGRS